MSRKQRLIRGGILLGLGIILAGLSIFYNYYNKPDDNNINEDSFLDYLGIRKDDNPGIDIYLDMIDNVSDPKEALKSVNNNEKVLFAITILEDSDSELTKDSIQEIIRTYFYTEDMVFEDIKCSCGDNLYIYNKETNSYEKNANHSEHDSNIIIKLVDKTYIFKQSDNKYILEIKKLYAKDENNCFTSDIENCEMKYYSDYYDAINSTNELFRTNSISAAKNKFIEISKDNNYKTYIYTFTNNNSISIEKYEKK